MAIMIDASAPCPSTALGRGALLARIGRVAGAAALLLLVFLATHQFVLATQTSGAALRRNLAIAAHAVETLPMTATAERVRRSVERPFEGFSASIDVSGFPAVVGVTLHGLDRQACIDAAAQSRRIAGLTVVELRDGGFPAACGERNDMTWRILP